MSRGCSPKTVLRQVLNRLPKQYFQHKHNLFGSDTKTQADRDRVLLLGSEGQVPENSLWEVRSYLLAVNELTFAKGLSAVPHGITRGALSQKDRLVQAFSMIPKCSAKLAASARRASRSLGSEIHTVTLNIKRRWCNYRRFIWRTANRPGQ